MNTMTQVDGASLSGHQRPLESDERTWLSFLQSSLFNDGDSESDSDSDEEDEDGYDLASLGREPSLAGNYLATLMAETHRGENPMADGWDSDLTSLFTVDDESIYTTLSKKTQILFENLPGLPASGMDRDNFNLPEAIVHLNQRAADHGLKEEDVVGIVEKLIAERERLSNRLQRVKANQSVSSKRCTLESGKAPRGQGQDAPSVTRQQQPQHVQPEPQDDATTMSEDETIVSGFVSARPSGASVMDLTANYTTYTGWSRPSVRSIGNWKKDIAGYDEDKKALVAMKIIKALAHKVEEEKSAELSQQSATADEQSVAGQSVMSSKSALSTKSALSVIVPMFAPKYVPKKPKKVAAPKPPVLPRVVHEPADINPKVSVTAKPAAPVARVPSPPHSTHSRVAIKPTITFPMFNKEIAGVSAQRPAAKPPALALPSWNKEMLDYIREKPAVAVVKATKNKATDATVATETSDLTTPSFGSAPAPRPASPPLPSAVLKASPWTPRPAPPAPRVYKQAMPPVTKEEPQLAPVAPRVVCSEVIKEEVSKDAKKRKRWWKKLFKLFFKKSFSGKKSKKQNVEGSGDYYATRSRRRGSMDHTVGESFTTEGTRREDDLESLFTIQSRSTAQLVQIRETSVDA